MLSGLAIAAWRAVCRQMPLYASKFRYIPLYPTISRYIPLYLAMFRLELICRRQRVGMTQAVTVARHAGYSGARQAGEGHLVRVTRRAVLVGAGAALAAPALGSSAAEALIKRIPATGEPVPAVGIGSWVTFNVGDDPLLRAECRAVMAAFFEAGGGIVDSSPMYGSSQAVIGDALATLGHPSGLFSADKVWTGADEGPAQIAETARRWGVERFDLLQVHNLIEWDANLDTLAAMKEAGALRYTGVTTSHGRRHGELEEVMRRRPPDFVQLTYNIVDRRWNAACCRLRWSAGSRSSATGPSSAAGCRTGLRAARCPAGRRRSQYPPGRNSC